MTIGIVIRVAEGVVLAADTATSMGVAGQEQGIGQIYHGARKIIRPHALLPFAMVTYGLGSIADQSIAQLAIQLRQRLGAGGEWAVDLMAYTLEQLSTRIRDYYAEHANLAIGNGHDLNSPLGFLVSGYSSGAETGETWEVGVDKDGSASGPTAVDPGSNASLAYRGFTSPLDRLIRGGDPKTLVVLAGLGASPPALQLIRAETPILDAIEVADWLSSVVKGAVEFSQIAPVVGGAIDLAHITQENGFGWTRQQQLPVDPAADQLN